MSCDFTCIFISTIEVWITKFMVVKFSLYFVINAAGKAGSIPTLSIMAGFSLLFSLFSYCLLHAFIDDFENFPVRFDDFSYSI